MHVFRLFAFAAESHLPPKNAFQSMADFLDRILLPTMNKQTESNEGARGRGLKSGSALALIDRILYESKKAMHVSAQARGRVLFQAGELAQAECPWVCRGGSGC